MAQDHAAWFFPLQAPLAFARVAPQILRDHIVRKMFDQQSPDGFPAGRVAFARKDEFHLRRVFVLDPISTFFLFDFVWANRRSFTRPKPTQRRHFGPAFARDGLVRSFPDYHAFRRRKYKLIRQSGAFCQADIFNCFNSFYHHDVVRFIHDKVGRPASIQVGQFLRELNAGDSVACFPQGFYPAKVIGNLYLSFIENARAIKSPSVIRYLDDIVMAGQNARECSDHLLALQRVLDDHHLALNDAKTRVGDASTRHREVRIDDIKRRLLQKREELGAEYDDGEEEQERSELDEEEREYLLALVERPDVAQEDVELALGLMQNEPEVLELLLAAVMDRAPHLLRQLHHFVADEEDDGQIWTAIRDRLNSTHALAEYDLFWLARIIIDYFDYDQPAADQLHAIYEHPAATPVVKAAILETVFLDHGLGELKERVLREGGALLESAAAMVGVRAMDKAARNQAYKYVKRNGSHYAVLAQIAADLPCAQP